MSQKRRLLYKDIDALRFFAMLPVFLFSGLYLLNNGENAFIADAVAGLSYLKQNSLDFFFFLSSFLLTSHALREFKYDKGFSLKNFYVRRVIRIAPVFAMALIFAFVVYPWIINTLKLTSIETHVSIKNFLLLPNSSGTLTPEQYIYLAVIWTIYMFIIFYLIWGLILKFFMQQIRYIGIVLIGIGLIARIYHILINNVYEFNLLCYGIPIGIGALVANEIRSNDRLVENIKHSPKANHLIIYLIGVVTLLAGYLFLGKTYAAAIIPLITCTFFGYFIIEQTFGKNSFFKLRKNKFIGRMGKISYGFIVYHTIILVVGLISIESLEINITSIGSQIIYLIMGFLLSWLIADLSYNWYERPIIAFKKEFKRS
ncbi:MAG: acyltransferase [Crocinitomicaceae bacterium]|nr:acyltransferase [Crocinitomicaceae bacterium]